VDEPVQTRISAAQRPPPWYPPSVEMDVSNRRAVPGNVRSNQESIQLRPLTFYGAVRSNSTRATLIMGGVEWMVRLRKERRPPFFRKPQSAQA
jgi:hypothetical protein